ncbi:MAG TPA: shikimate dehydrogenase [Chitinophagaceae bacterium]|nr:shikimate dehydrogenase [Chitinophagaceae bacterium]
MRLFGLIGYPLTHSFSQQYFTKKFEKEYIRDCSYVNLPLPTIEKFRTVQQQYPNLVGCNVTIPYKQSILDYIDEQFPIVQQIGACNCIHFKNGKSIAHNTDVIGFKKSFLEKRETHHTTALILGTGGASKAVQYVLEALGISYTLVSRTKKDNVITYEEITPSLLQSYTIIIQTTPLGTYPNVNDAPEMPYHALTPKHYCFDLIYNPAETLFLQKAKLQGAIIQNGYYMLCIQAEESWKIWNS